MPRRCLRGALEIREVPQGASISMSKERIAWAHHIGRFGTGPRENHLVKNLVLWRDLRWWRHQQHYNRLGVSPFKHPNPGKLLRWEESLPTNWLEDSLSRGEQFW